MSHLCALCLILRDSLSLIETRIQETDALRLAQFHAEPLKFTQIHPASLRFAKSIPLRLTETHSDSLRFTQSCLDIKGVQMGFP